MSGGLVTAHAGILLKFNVARLIGIEIDSGQKTGFGHQSLRNFWNCCGCVTPPAGAAAFQLFARGFKADVRPALLRKLETDAGRGQAGELAGAVVLLFSEFVQLRETLL